MPEGKLKKPTPEPAPEPPTSTPDPALVRCAAAVRGLASQVARNPGVISPVA
jgi:hypothetical protein